MRVAVVLAALVLAGCVEAPDLGRPAAVDGVVASLAKFSTPTLVDAARWSGEPSIVVDGAGAIVITGAGGMTRYATYPQDAPNDAGQSYIWVSNDFGETFRFVSHSEEVRFRVGGGAGGIEGDLAVSPDGSTVYFVDLIGLFEVATARSTDHGNTWMEGNPAASPVPLDDRPWVAAGPGQTVYVSLLQLAQGIWVLKSTDGGVTFPQAAPVSTEQAFGGGRPAVDAASGKLYVPLTDESANKPYVAVSSDEGKTFEIRELPTPYSGSFGNLPWLDVDDAGTVHYVFAQQAEDEAFDVLYTSSTDAGATWSEARVLNPSNTTALMPSIEARGNGNVMVVWYEAPGRVDSNQAPEDTPWAVGYALSATQDGEARFPTGHATPIIHEGIICTAGLNCAQTTGGSTAGRKLLDFLDVDATPEGTPVIAYTTTLANAANEPRVAFVKVAEGASLA